MSSASTSSTDEWLDPDTALHPKMQLFISFDLIGSTAIKQKARDDEGGSLAWVKHISDFLAEIPVIYVSSYEDIVRRCCTVTECVNSDKSCLLKESDYYQNIEVWKYIGDEAVLTTELKCDKGKQPLLHLLAVRNALDVLNQKFEKTPDRMSFKGCVWVAGFPVGNVAMDLPMSRGSGEKIRDYLGPSIDIGFRLAHHSTEERIADRKSVV